MTETNRAAAGNQLDAGQVRERFERSLPFGLDDFQIAALDALDAGASVVVAAPTGSGKTVVAEYAIERALAVGGRVFYTAPIKALSNQKFNDLRRRLGAAKVGLLTGDNSVNDRAPVVVMTTEVLRNMIYVNSPALSGLKTVVLDEVHYLQDQFRGPVWEEVIIHTPPEVDLVCLSATVSNATELADWVTTVRGRTIPVIHEIRPIELEHLYLVSERASGDVRMLPTFVGGRANPQAAKLDADPDGGPQYRGSTRSLATPRRVEVIEALQEQDMLPVITFVFSRNGCNEAVNACLSMGLRLTSPDERRAIKEIAAARLAGLSKQDLQALDHQRFLDGLERGFAAHHAGMVPAFKETVEACFIDGLVKAVFATETLALGINMPARTVVIEKLSKFGGDRHKFLTAGEFTQLTGRAGRRGIDSHGFAATLWTPFVRFEEVATLASNRTFELRSAFRPTNNMTINLVRRYGPTEARHLLGLSFAQFQVDRDLVSNRRRVETIQREIDEAEQHAACELGDVRDYLRLREKRSSRPAATDRVVEEGLERLRPGDVLAPVDSRGLVVDVARNARAGDGWVVVIATARRKDRPVTVRAVGPNGKLLSLTARDFRSEPHVLATVRLPTPLNPNSRSFVSAAGQSLMAVMGKHGVDRKGSRTEPSASQKRSGGTRPLADSHPVTGCGDLNGHLRALRRIEILAPEIDRLGRIANARSNSLNDEFERILDLLERLSYLEGWKVTNNGDLLAGLFHESDLFIAECILDGVFDGLAPAAVAGLASVFVYESRGPSAHGRVAAHGRAGRGNSSGDQNTMARRGDLPPGFPKTLASRWWAIGEVHAELSVDLAEYQLPAIREPDPGFVSLAHRWAAGESLRDVLRSTATLDAPTGGDFVRTTKSLIDLLRQLGTVAPVEATREAARAAAELLSRGVVAASSLGAVLTEG